MIAFQASIAFTAVSMQIQSCTAVYAFCFLSNSPSVLQNAYFSCKFTPLGGILVCKNLKLESLAPSLSISVIKVPSAQKDEPLSIGKENLQLVHSEF